MVIIKALFQFSEVLGFRIYYWAKICDEECYVVVIRGFFYFHVSSRVWKV